MGLILCCAQGRLRRLDLFQTNPWWRRLDFVMELCSLLGNSQQLDGGAMFGNAPQAVWSRWIAPDAQNRIPLACRCLLVKDLDGSNVLFETGIGAFFEPKLRERYGVVEDRHVLLDSLAAIGLTHEDIDVVVLSHLHFDHAGGLLAAWEAGPGPASAVSQRAFRGGRGAAGSARCSRIRATAPLHPGTPAAAAGQRSPGDRRRRTFADARAAVRFHFSDGHTPGLMLRPRVEAAGVVFCADLIPGRPWVHVPITMGYDRYPELLIDEKREFLEDKLARNVHLFFTHDHACALAQVTRDARGRFGTTDEHAVLRATVATHAGGLE